MRLKCNVYDVYIFWFFLNTCLFYFIAFMFGEKLKRTPVYTCSFYMLPEAK